MTSDEVRAELRHRQLLPHQVEFIQSVLYARAGSRVLLADDVGLGKTHASAALVRAWEEHRQHGSRVLVVGPSPLMQQWRDQLAENTIDARIVDAADYRRLEARTVSGENPWNAVDVAITSVDFVKQNARLRALLDATWDLVIFDEAHVARDGSQRGAVLRGLLSSESVDVVVALSATPIGVSNDPSPPAGFDVVIRRRAGDIRDWDGRPILQNVPDQVVETVFVSLSAEERQLLEAVRYLLGQVAAEHGATRFQMQGLARAAGSSLFAFEQSLRRAIARGKERGVLVGGIGEEPGSESDATILEVADRDGQLPRAALDQLLELVDRIVVDRKWAACEDMLRRRSPAEALQTLVFCDLVDTARYVTGLLGVLERPLFLITGATPADERHESIDTFRRDGGVLIVTSAASEGFSFSFVKLCVHYDLPWNPTVLAQRLGRVDRIGAPPGPVRHVVFADEIFRTDRLARKLFAFDETLGLGAGAWLSEVLRQDAPDA